MRNKRTDEGKIKVISPITVKSLRSIEELAKIGMPFSFLSREQQRWLLAGGLEYFKEEKPYLYPVVKQMVERKAKDPIPWTFEELAQLAQEKLGFKVHPAHVEKLVRWKLDPFYTKSEKMAALAKALLEVVEEAQKREGEERYKWLRKTLQAWIKWNEKAREVQTY